MKNNINKKFVKLVVISILIVFLTTSVNSAIVKNQTNNESSSPVIETLGEYYEWKDDFDNEQKIDITQSWGYVVEGGVAKMKNTYTVWTDPAWQKLVPITVTNPIGTLYNYALNFIVQYDSDMQNDYDDVRFKHENTPTTYLSYWLESYSSTEASFWVKVPELKSGTNYMYLFYGNPSATSESNYGNVFTVWDEQWANDEQITLKYNKEGCWDPDVSYGNNEFLVCWEQGMPHWHAGGCPGFRQEIRASIYEPDGDRVVYNKYVFKDNNVDYWRNENPSIAYGANKWFVAWEHYEPIDDPSITTEDIYARTVVRNGNDIQVGSLIYVCTANNCQADANVEFDSVNSRFMVVWEDGRDGTSDYDIRASTYSSSGSVIVDNKLLCNDANSQCEPWAAYDPENQQYFIVWEDGVDQEDGPFRIKGGLFDDDLNSVSTFVVAEPSGYPNQDIDYNFPCVEYDAESERFLVTWQDDDLSDGDWKGNIYGKIYNSAGTVVVDKFTIESGDYERTDIVPYLSEAFFVSYDNNEKVYGRIVTSTGTLLGSTIQMAASSAAVADWNKMATDGSDIFVVWEDTRVNYPDPYNWLPDCFGNIWNLNIPDPSDITIVFGQEKELILEAQITSKEIAPTNLDRWHQFLVVFDGSITFDLIFIDDQGQTYTIQNAGNGQDISGIDPDTYIKVKLRAHFTRTVPSSSPTINSWSILYQGIDTEKPVTSVDHIDGTQGLNGWYTSECITIWLKAIDLPEATGSGVNHTYYTIDGGITQTYDEGSGIHICSHEPNYYGSWMVNFWSVDYKGNIEDKTKPENYRSVKIDSKRPECTITSPTEDQAVTIPFEVYATASDNAGVKYVEFDIEPYNSNPGCPARVTTPPYVWTCNVPHPRTLETQPSSAGVLKHIKATAYDDSGQYWLREVWVRVTNWGKSKEIVIIHNFDLILEKFSLGFVINDNLKIEITKPQNADTTKFVATKIPAGKQITIMDNDFSDGCSASFNLPTGLYKITSTNYKEGEVLASSLILRVFFVHR